MRQALTKEQTQSIIKQTDLSNPSLAKDVNKKLGKLPKANGKPHRPKVRQTFIPDLTGLLKQDLDLKLDTSNVRMHNHTNNKKSKIKKSQSSNMSRSKRKKKGTYKK